MKTYFSADGNKILVGENAKENDTLTESSNANEWWLHADGGAGSHVVICHETDVIPKETKRDAAVLAIHHSKQQKMRSARVNLVRVGQVWKDPRIKNHGQVYLTGEVTQLNIFMNKEKDRLDRLKKRK